MTKTTKLIKAGRILAILLAIYLFVLPFVAMFIADAACGSSPNEFCGLWIVVIAPHLLILNDLSSYVSLSVDALLVILMAVAGAVLALKWTLARYSKKQIGFGWSFVLFAILSPAIIFTVNSALYPSSSQDWQTWSQKAISSDDPSICLQKVDGGYQTDCLFIAARFSGNPEFCQALPSAKQNVYEGIVGDCQTDIAVTKRASQMLCSTEYDPECLERYCDERYTEEFSCQLFESGSITYFVFALASSVNDPTLCDLYMDAEYGETRVKACKDNVALTKQAQ
ncbi:hypothetical protein A2304_03585 [Candidatus Uhrbacteria bacterium RIFOXYB2_FULL_57_15]|uniref:Uncharacterized protein n=1 Tax=Candidatus Uhrbacteria bacterium RIFOXYB2_FULL_57_15 TaxID=1802422 RepID=A0A1F7W7R5_9BACT|nr:MAG: hypothetical protein A2304_03585 [Candidatus Uhrbacteria bacterium RIFOXYB2_FULL_57_15]OGM00118.1 MAG: hypothetical protein A2501_01240 [Candidatus Uhrbacteria bacterium RIFOXYC12_FULL_57_11]